MRAKRIAIENFPQPDTYLDNDRKKMWEEHYQHAARAIALTHERFPQAKRINRNFRIKLPEGKSYILLETVIFIEDVAYLKLTGGYQQKGEGEPMMREDISPLTQLLLPVKGKGLTGSVVPAIKVADLIELSNGKLPPVYGIKGMRLSKNSEKAEYMIARAQNEVDIYRKIYGIGAFLLLNSRDKDKVYLLLPYFRGEELLDYLQYYTMDAELPDYYDGKFFFLCKQVLHAILQFQQLGIIHGDIKLDNFMVVPSPEVSEGMTLKLIDFGFSVQGIPDEMNGEMQFPPRCRVRGTPQYLAPEGFFAGNPYSLAEDAWSVGVLISVLFQRVLHNKSKHALLTETMEMHQVIANGRLGNSRLPLAYQCFLQQIFQWALGLCVKVDLYEAYREYKKNPSSIMLDHEQANLVWNVIFDLLADEPNQRLSLTKVAEIIDQLYYDEPLPAIEPCEALKSLEHSCPLDFSGFNKNTGFFTRALHVINWVFDHIKNNAEKLEIFSRLLDAVYNNQDDFSRYHSIFVEALMPIREKIAALQAEIDQCTRENEATPFGMLNPIMKSVEIDTPPLDGRSSSSLSSPLLLGASSYFMPNSISALPEEEHKKPKLMMNEQEEDPLNETPPQGCMKQFS